MPRFLHVTDHLRRDATVATAGPSAPPKRTFVGPEGQPARSTRLIKATEGHDYVALWNAHPDAESLAASLIAGDPEVDLEQVGRPVGPVNQVWVSPDGKVLYAARTLRVVYAPDGTEKTREDFIDVEATVSEEVALPWSGRLFPVERVVRNFALVQKVQLRHINGLTFDFLLGLARHLQEKQAMLVLRAGEKGEKALIFQRNGSSYFGFLEGRATEDAFLLVLHLSNLELKAGGE